MGGIFGVASENSCMLDLFFGVDYRPHLGAKRGGMAVYGEQGFTRSIYNVENIPFRTKFDGDLAEPEGYLGIDCISDNEPQPLLIQPRLGNLAITTAGKISNLQELVQDAYQNDHIHLMEMSHGRINATGLVAALINQKATLVKGLLYAQERTEGSMTILVLTPQGIYASRDKYGRTPVMIGKKEDAFCASFENFAYINLGYSDYMELGPGEIVYIAPESVETLSPPRQDMKICVFSWVYCDYPTSTYEGVNVKSTRYQHGKLLSRRDKFQPDIVADMPDSGIAHAIGYANASGIPFARPFIKYTPTWLRSSMPQNQEDRNLIARMKLIPVDALIHGKKLLLIDDSIVKGTQLGETTQLLCQSGTREVHIRSACPPLMYGCPYLNFSRSSSELDLITRKIIKDREGSCVSDQFLADYADPDSRNYQEMMEVVRNHLGFTSLRYHKLDDLVEAIRISPCKLCTYCWSGKK